MCQHKRISAALTGVRSLSPRRRIAIMVVVVVTSGVPRYAPGQDKQCATVITEAQIQRELERRQRRTAGVIAGVPA